MRSVKGVRTGLGEKKTIREFFAGGNPQGKTMLKNPQNINIYKDFG